MKELSLVHETLSDESSTISCDINIDFFDNDLFKQQLYDIWCGI